MSYAPTPLRAHSLASLHSEHPELPAASVQPARAPLLFLHSLLLPRDLRAAQATRERAAATGPDRLAGTIAAVGSFHLWRRAVGAAAPCVSQAQPKASCWLLG